MSCEQFIPFSLYKESTTGGLIGDGVSREITLASPSVIYGVVLQIIAVKVSAASKVMGYCSCSTPRFQSQM